ncbi:hypothetical protein SERLA73DRAFT_151554 [Serpula lacrymans var. lacrymans S7.3]|uniref:Uncharacterized protein n=1 Tax=Serpula lacrymans var. lacrymans (strain S7.3) TaxID=936435 RepID=F8PTC5_SERL3|nr:hypothetical protein SERLA73DRAFT_151554 [Serpula lacrymans var. lacrymans S7.3]
MPNALKNTICKNSRLHAEMVKAKHQLKEEQKKAEEEAWQAAEAQKAEEKRVIVEMEKAEKEKEKTEKAKEAEVAESGEMQSRASNHHQCKKEGNTVTGTSKGKRRAPVELEALEVAEHSTKRKKAVVFATKKLEEGWQAQIVCLLGILKEKQKANRQLLELQPILNNFAKKR